MDVRPLFTIDYWFNTRPTALEPFFQEFFFYFFITLIVGALVIGIIAKRKKKADPWIAQGFQRISSWCLTMGVAGLVIFFFTYERLPFLSMRFWYLLWFIAAIAWLIQIVHFFKTRVKVEKMKITEKENIEKYLPNKK